MAGLNHSPCRLAFLGGAGEESFLQSLSTQVAIPGPTFVSGRRLEKYKNSGWDYCVIYSPSVSDSSIKSLVHDAAQCPTNPTLILLLPRRDTKTLEEELREMGRSAQVILLKTPDITAAAELINSYLILKEKIKPPHPNWGFVGASEPVHKLYEEIESFAGWDMEPVLILGQTGSGKELVAKHLHKLSGRGNHPFVPYNLATLPPQLAESILFGHTKGAFTGADAPSEGLIMKAGEGTLFLDEIGETDPDIQVKLLRILQDRRVSKLGDEAHLKKVEARFVFATNREWKELKTACRRGQFREDFLQRIDVLRINVPSLSERREDIPLLVTRFIKEFKDEYSPDNKERKAREHDAVNYSKLKDIRVDNLFNLDALFEYGWPGNVRELRGVIRRAITQTRAGAIDSQLAKVIAERQEDIKAEQEEVGAGEAREQPAPLDGRARAVASYVETLLEENLNTAENGFRQLYEQELFLKTRGDIALMKVYSGRAKENISLMKGRQNRSQFNKSDLIEADHLATRLKEGGDPVSAYIRDQNRRLVKDAAGQRNGSPAPGELVDTLVILLNHLRGDKNLPQVVERTQLSDEVKALIDVHGELTDLLLLNRMLIEDIYPESVIKDEALREEVRKRFDLSPPSSET